MTVRDILEVTRLDTEWVRISDECTGDDIIAVNPYLYDTEMLSDRILNQTVYHISPINADVLRITVRMLGEEGGATCEN